MTGRVVERKVELGTAVGRDNLETEIFVDRRSRQSVWVDLAVSPADLPSIREGQTVSITRAWNCRRGRGQDRIHQPDARQGNTFGARGRRDRQQRRVWRPGSFVTADDRDRGTSGTNRRSRRRPADDRAAIRWCSSERPMDLKSVRCRLGRATTASWRSLRPARGRNDRRRATLSCSRRELMKALAED